MTFTKRIGTSEGKRHCPVVIGPNGRIKPDWVMMTDRREKHPEGGYYLDWNEDGKRRRMQWMRSLVPRCRCMALAITLIMPLAIIVLELNAAKSAGSIATSKPGQGSPAVAGLKPGLTSPSLWTPILRIVVVLAGIHLPRAGWQHKIAAVVQEAVEQKQLPSDTEPELPAGFLLNSREGALLRSQAEESDAPLATFMRQVFDR